MIFKFLGHLKRRLCVVNPRYRFRAICRAIRIVPYPWQRDYACALYATLPANCSGRCTGKTMAVMLKLLMGAPLGSSWSPHHEIAMDPDWKPDDWFRVSWYCHEYDRLYSLCMAAGIPMWRIDLRSYSKISRV